MALIVMAAVWKQISYNFLFFLAGLQSIPKRLIEAAAIDGAGPWRRFWTIQFPLLSPTTFFLLVINIVYAFFDTFAHHRCHDPGRAWQGHDDPRLQGLLRRLQGVDLGGSAAQSVVLMAIVIVLTSSSSATSRRRCSTERWSNAVPSRASSPPRAGARLLIVAFPLYLAFVASTHTAQDIVQAPMPLLPGGNLVETYTAALFGGGAGRGSTAPVGAMMWVSLVTALVITFGKIAISLLSAFAIVYFRFPLRSCSSGRSSSR